MPPVLLPSPPLLPTLQVSWLGEEPVAGVWSEKGQVEVFALRRLLQVVDDPQALATFLRDEQTRVMLGFHCRMDFSLVVVSGALLSCCRMHCGGFSFGQTVHQPLGHVRLLHISVPLNTQFPLPVRLHCPWDSPGKNTGEGCQFLLQCMNQTEEEAGLP